MSKSLSEITGKELAQVEEAYLIRGFETLTMNDEEFHQFFLESLMLLDHFEYELLEDGLINVELIQAHLR